MMGTGGKSLSAVGSISKIRLEREFPMKIIEKLRKFSPGKNTEKYYTKTPHKNITQILHKNITQKYYKNITQKYYTKILHKQTYGYYTQEPIRTTLRQNTNATNCDILYTTLKFTAPHAGCLTKL